MRHLTLRNAIHLLLLLALLAGGQVSAAMTMPTPQGGAPIAGAPMPDMDCAACGAAVPASGPCEILCAALPTIVPGAVELAAAGSRDGWTSRTRSGPTHTISPETSPPRA